MIQQNISTSFWRRGAAWALAGLAVPLLALWAQPAQGAGLYAEVIWEIFCQASAANQHTQTTCHENSHCRSTQAKASHHCTGAPTACGARTCVTQDKPASCGFARQTESRCSRMEAQPTENDALIRQQVQEAGFVSWAPQAVPVPSGAAVCQSRTVAVPTGWLCAFSEETPVRASRETEQLKKTVAQQAGQITGLIQRMEALQGEILVLRQQVQVLQQRPYPIQSPIYMPVPNPYPPSPYLKVPASNPYPPSPYLNVPASNLSQPVAPQTSSSWGHGNPWSHSTPPVPGYNY